MTDPYGPVHSELRLKETYPHLVGRGARVALVGWPVDLSFRRPDGYQAWEPTFPECFFLPEQLYNYRDVYYSRNYRKLDPRRPIYISAARRVAVIVCSISSPPYFQRNEG